MTKRGLTPVILPAPAGAACRTENDTVIVEDNGSNSFAVFDVRAVVFDYEADMEFRTGYHAAGLVFGADDPHNLRNRWFAVHVQPARDHTVRVFCEFDWMQPDGLESGYLPVSASDAEGLIHIRVTVDGHNLLRVFIGHGDTPVFERVMTEYKGGYVGMMSWASEAVFSHIRLSVLPIPHLTALSVGGAVLETPFDEKCRAYTAAAPAESVAVTVAAKSDSGIVKVNGQPLPPDGSAVLPLGRYGTDAILSLYAEEDGETPAESVSLRIRHAPAPPLYREPFRPQLRFTPARFWCNDPNGLVYNADTGEYHFFFQYVPDALYHNGQVEWGHAVSRDLVHWEELAPAITPDPVGTIWSGSAVVDRENTSGLFTDATPPDSRIVAIYTHTGYGPEPGEGGGQRVDIAYSPDGGRTMIKYPGNSVIPNYGDMYGADFRDPCVVWMPETRLWLMTVAGGRAHFFTSPDLIHWEFNSLLTYADGREIWSECPALMRLPLDGDPAHMKWVYSGGGVFCVVGDVVYEDGRYVFRAETDALPFRCGVQYASQDFKAMPDGRTVMLSWLVETTEDKLCHWYKNWTGTFSVPEEVVLKTVNGQPRPVTTPAPELDVLRGRTLSSLRDVTVTPGGEDPLAGVRASVYELTAELDARAAEGFTLGLRVGNGCVSRLTYDTGTNRLTVDGRASGVLPTAVTSVAVEPNGRGTVTLRVLSDNGALDVYANPATPPVSMLSYPPEGAEGMTLEAVGGQVRVLSLAVTEMNSIWNCQ